MPGCVDFLPSCGQGAAWFLARCAEVAGRWQYTGATAYWSATLCWLLAEYCTRWHFSPFQRALTDTALSRWNRPREVKRSVVPHGHCQLAYEPRQLGASFLLSHGVIPPHNLRQTSEDEPSRCYQVLESWPSPSCGCVTLCKWFYQLCWWQLICQRHPM